MKLTAAVTLALLMSAITGFGQNPKTDRVGPLPEGAKLLNNGWVLRPVGTQIPVDTFPSRSVLSPDGRFLLVLNNGYNPPSLSVIDVASKKEVQRTPIPDAWYGLAFGPNGKNVYVGGGSKGFVYQLTYDTATGAVKPLRQMLTEAKQPAAATTAPKNTPGSDPAAAAAQTFIGDIAVSPDGHLLYAADVARDQIAVINLQSGRPIERWKCGRRPYRLKVSRDGATLLVSSWADATVYRYSASNGGALSPIRVASHPTDLAVSNKPASIEGDNGPAFVSRLFIAAANTNNVYVMGETSDGDYRRFETINLGSTAMQPLGLTPSALSINADSSRLYVACSDSNTVAVVDISESPARVIGLVPTGWYPTGVASLADGGLAILNGKGKGSAPNPQGPDPTQTAAPLASAQSIPRQQTGTVQIVSDIETRLRSYSETAQRSTPYTSDQLRVQYRGENVNSFAKGEGHPSPIEHVIYVIKEGRTYDQVLGDLPKGAGAKELAAFGRAVTPNLHKLADTYVLYDNFYANGDVSAEGQSWAFAAIGTDYVVKSWPGLVSNRRARINLDQDPANLAPAGYLWTNAVSKAITMRNYGVWTSADPVLIASTDAQFPGADLTVPDTKRAEEFIREWKEFEAKDKAPQLTVVRLANDGTNGLAPGQLSPNAMVADNDQAVGQLVEAVSHGKFWQTTAIFITEASTEYGADHIDSHRAPLWVVSPYTKRGGMVDSTMYNQVGVLRTIEALLDLRPMTQFDASATTLFGSFTVQPDGAPFSAEKPGVSLTERNPGTSK